MILDIIIFEVGTATFALNLDAIKRINTIPKITPLRRRNGIIEGMISFESSILHVASLSSLLGQVNFSDELLKKFNELIDQHNDWLRDLQDSIETGVAFTGALNAHSCLLGEWIDSFTSYDDSVSSILRELTSNHTKLHSCGADIVALLSQGKQTLAEELFRGDLTLLFSKTIAAMNLLKGSYKLVANSLQKLLLYRNKEEYFAIKVDKVLDIIHIEESDIVQEKSKINNEFITFSGIIEVNGTLVNVIETIKLAK